MIISASPMPRNNPRNASALLDTARLPLTFMEVIVYGSGFDKIDRKRLERLRSPVLVIAGGEDTGATQAAINFLSTMREAKRPCEILVYPSADHGYAQPLFNEGKNYNPQAVRTTWIIVEDFLGSHL